MDEPNSLRNPEFLKDLEFIKDQLSTVDIGQHQKESGQKSEVNEMADFTSAHATGSELHLNQELEEACLATGATGAAIALVQGDKIVCHATAGPDAPDIGVCLDPRHGLSGSCIQARQLQQCSDTETDPRVDPDASRRLGVRSIVVLPLIKAGQLFGIFEILSSRPNAFGQRDLDALQSLANRIVENKRPILESAVPVPSEQSASSTQKAEQVIDQDGARSSRSASAVPRHAPVFRRAELTTAALGVLVIVSAVLLGTLTGWRLGWQKATHELRASSARYRVSAPSHSQPASHTLPRGNELQPNLGRTDECGQSAPAGLQNQPPTGGLTVCQDGRVIFRLPASTPLPIPEQRTAKRVPAVVAGPAGR